MITFFDTLRFIRTLHKAGIPEVQAEAISDAVRNSYEAADVAMRVDFGKFKTDLRHDFRKLETDLRHDFGKLETNLRHEINYLRKDMETLRKDIIIKLSAVMLAIVTLAPSFSKLLHLS